MAHAAPAPAPGPGTEPRPDAAIRVGELQVAAAGHALRRLLLRAPTPVEIEQLSSPALRASWPLASERSREALDRIGRGLDPVRAAGDFAALMGPGSVHERLGRALGGLATACAQMARTPDAATARESAERQLALRGGRIDPLARVAVADLRERAGTEPYLDLPDLLEDLLDAHTAVCCARVREGTAIPDA